MSDDDAIARDLQRAQYADQLLSNPLWQEAYEGLRARYLQEWNHTKPLDVRAREHLWLIFQLTSVLETHFKAMISSGTLSTAHLRQVAKFGQSKPKANGTNENVSFAND